MFTPGNRITPGLLHDQGDEGREQREVDGALERIGLAAPIAVHSDQEREAQHDGLHVGEPE